MSIASTTRRRTVSPDKRWVKPLSGYGITTPYGIAGSMWSSGAHTGADFAAPTGTRVSAVAPGRVTSAGPAGAYGNRIVITHSPGFETWYCHLSAMFANPGELVGAGQHIGAVGATGNTTGPHLHLEVRVNGVHRNPAPYLDGSADAPDSGAADLASTPEFDTGAPPTNLTGNPALQTSGNSFIVGDIAAEIRRLAIIATVVIGGTALVAVGVAQGTRPMIKKAVPLA